MSERFETKHCIKALYKYSSFPFFKHAERVQSSLVTITSITYQCFERQQYWSCPVLSNDKFSEIVVYDHMTI